MTSKKTLLLLTDPAHFGVTYAINPWMQPRAWAQDPVGHLAAARRSFQSLVSALATAGARLEVMQGVAGLPDMVFPANAAVVLDRHALLARFRHPERQGEEQHFQKYFHALMERGLLDGAEILSQSGNPSITGVEYDSRRVHPGIVFVAMKGESSDGNRFIDQAIAAGAVAIVTDSQLETPRTGIAWAQVPRGRRALARVSANFYKHPAERIANTGITGTNGKSTTAFIIESILNAAKA